MKAYLSNLFNGDIVLFGIKVKVMCNLRKFQGSFIEGISNLFEFIRKSCYLFKEKYNFTLIHSINIEIITKLILYFYIQYYKFINKYSVPEGI